MFEYSKKKNRWLEYKYISHKFPWYFSFVKPLVLKPRILWLLVMKTVPAFLQAWFHNQGSAWIHTTDAPRALHRWGESWWWSSSDYSYSLLSDIFFPGRFFGVGRCYLLSLKLLKSSMKWPTLYSSQLLISRLASLYNINHKPVLDLIFLKKKKKRKKTNWWVS